MRVCECLCVCVCVSVGVCVCLCVCLCYVRCFSLHECHFCVSMYSLCSFIWVIINCETWYFAKSQRNLHFLKFQLENTVFCKIDFLLFGGKSVELCILQNKMFRVWSNINCETYIYCIYPSVYALRGKPRLSCILYDKKEDKKEYHWKKVTLYDSYMRRCVTLCA